MDRIVMDIHSPISTKLFINLLLALIGVAVALVLLELGLRFTRDSPGDSVSLHTTCGECPYLYSINPDHPSTVDESSQLGYSPEQLQSTFNVVVLGDSVTYGTGVQWEDAFPQRLDSLLDMRHDDVAVFNSAVSGYTPYNQLHQFRNRTDDVPTDLVIVVFTMNDVVDPELHWNYTEETITNIPLGAYPNLKYHEEHVVPLLEARRSGSLLSGTRLGQRIATAINVTNITYQDASYATVDGHRWPTYITGEDTISIEVLTNYDSPEWTWLRRMYDQLAEAVRTNGAELVIAITPLAYQMDARYPFLPQELFARYCEERSLLCLDLLPAFREHDGLELFLGQQLGYLDIWHLSNQGHILVADELRKFTEEHDLIGRH